jgi:acyl-CoA thioesterase FadM
MNHAEPFTLQTRVGFIDTDASGRIHNTAMFRYFEAAETEFMRRLGIEYKGSNYLFPGSMSSVILCFRLFTTILSAWR